MASLILALYIAMTPAIAVAPEHAEIQTLTGSAPVVQNQVSFFGEISRGEEPIRIERVVMECTAYTAGYESTGKLPSDSDYGQTAISTPANPVYAREWYTVAAPSEIPIGTEIYIPYFVDKPNKGIFVVEDRGGGITTGKLDIYFGDPAVDDTALPRALEFGRRDLEVYIKY